MLTKLQYEVAGDDVILTLEVGGEKYKETWSKFTATSDVYTATPILTQIQDKLFKSSGRAIQKAVADLGAVLLGSTGVSVSQLAALISFISFVEGIAIGKYQCTASEFARLRGFVDVAGTLLSIDKASVYELLMANSEACAAADESVNSEDSYDDISLADRLLLCLLKNREQFDELFTLLEEHLRTYTLADTNVYFSRAIPDLIGHIRGDIDGKQRAEVLERFSQWAKVEDPLGLIGRDRIVNLESGVTRVLYVLSGMRQIYAEVKECTSLKRGVQRKVLKDIDTVVQDIENTLAAVSYDFTVEDIESVLNNSKYFLEDVAHSIVSGSVDDIG